MAKADKKDAPASASTTETSNAGATAETSNAVATTEAAGGAVAEYGAYAEYAGQGFENQTSDDYAIPFLGILQALSPQIAENPEGPYRQGMIVNTVTGEVWKGSEGVAFVPALTEHLYVEWVPREKGGGFVAAHKPTDDVTLKAMDDAKAANLPYGELHTPNGNDLIETFYVYGVALTEAGDQFEAVLGFSSTKIKPYKGWMTRARTIQIEIAPGRRIPAPLFSHRYRLRTVSEKNAKGQFYNWVIKFDSPDDTALAARLVPSDPLFQAAVAIKKLVESGKARAAAETQSPGSGREEETSGAAPGKPVF